MPGHRRGGTGGIGPVRVHVPTPLFRITSVSQQCFCSSNIKLQNLRKALEISILSHIILFPDVGRLKNMLSWPVALRSQNMESRRMTSRLSIWCLVGFIAVLAFLPQVEGRGVQSSWELRTFIFFTDGSRNPLSADSTGNPMVTAVVSGNTMQTTIPGQVVVWVEVQHTGFNATFQSLAVNATLPVDWVISPTWGQARGAIHVYFVNTTTLDSPDSASFASSVLPNAFDITQPSRISVSNGGVQVLIPDLAATPIGHHLMPDQTILLSIKLGYALKGTIQPANSYPRQYVSSASSKGWIGFPTYPGSVAFSPSACYDSMGMPHDCFFTAYARG